MWHFGYICVFNTICAKWKMQTYNWMIYFASFLHQYLHVTWMSCARSWTEWEVSPNSYLKGQLKITALKTAHSIELRKSKPTNLLIQFCLCCFGFVMQDQEPYRQTRNSIPGSQSQQEVLEPLQPPKGKNSKMSASSNWKQADDGRDAHFLLQVCWIWYFCCMQGFFVVRDAHLWNLTLVHQMHSTVCVRRHQIQTQPLKHLQNIKTQQYILT